MNADKKGKICENQRLSASNKSFERHFLIQEQIYYLTYLRAGPTRKVPVRKGMTWEEEDWIDEDATAHREEDE